MDTETRKILAKNLRILYEVTGMDAKKVSKASKLSQRAVNGWERGEKAATLDSVDGLSKALKVPAWLLLFPHLDKIAIDSDRLAKLIKTFAELPDDGREQVARVAEAEARYHQKAA